MKTKPEDRSRRTEAEGQRPEVGGRRSKAGVALIITLILLAVVTVMAVAFLATSRRERGAVTTSTDTANARLAADAALAQAEAQIMARVIATTNPYNFGLVVSTNYINPAGFNPAAGANPTNVNYQYANGTALDPGDLQQNVANLLYSPRAPVFIQTNTANPAAPPDFRFYLDLNRNGIFDTNGFVVEVDNNNNIVRTNFNEVGDPEWIGVLDHPDQPHGPNNRFIARYAFVAVPIGNALDLNAIYNYATRPDANMNAGDDGFLRNQGVGSWEINLAAFLTDLNTNQWDPPTTENTANNLYDYLTYSGTLYNSGEGFEDALSLLKYRYGGVNGTYANLFPANALFPFTAPFLNDIDAYSQGPLMTTTTNININLGAFIGAWAGADNTNQFFDMQELFNKGETEIGVNPPGFTDRLLAAGNATSGTSSTSTYDRYTFYRLMSQLGVDSAPEQGKMNLNYDNLDPGLNGVLNANGTASVTNFVPWTPLGFFTNAADRMLRAYSQDWLTRDPGDYMLNYDMSTNIGTVNFPTNVPVSFGITNIPVWIGASNQFVYSSAIQRVLQLAANIYDATTNNTFALGNNFPSVFRPTFNVVLENGFTNVYINGYEQVASVPLGPDDPQLGLPVAVTDLASDYGFGSWTNVNVYGVPWIIGAKKGFPNFNQFSMEEVVGVERRLQVNRTANYVVYQTNQMITMTVSNSLGVDCWNSYSNNYVPVSALGLNIVANDNISMTVTNDEGMSVTEPTPAVIPTFANPTPTNIAVWYGTGTWLPGTQPNPYSFAIPLNESFSMPLNTSYQAYTNWWQYVFSPIEFLPPNLEDFETNVNNNFTFPDFVLLTTNQLQVFMLDGNHVIDYVQFAGPITSLDIKTNLFTDNDAYGVWNTNLSTVGVPAGILNQIAISRGLPGYTAPPTEDGPWNSDRGNSAIPPAALQYSFNEFFYPTAVNPELSVEAPYLALRYVTQYTTWQANDPLVHYLASDLNYTQPSGTPTPGISQITYGTQTTNFSLGALNYHYSPWGGNPMYPPNPNTDDPNLVDQYNLAVKDPVVYSSDNWNFPTNKLPTVGWLGRVHRGTPWQTVYLKATNVLAAVNGVNNWVNWTGDSLGLGFDAYNSSPVEDWQLFDLFSTAFNDNATRGQLSVNVGANDTNNPQAGLAAWSAVLSGVVVPTNTSGGYTIIQPAGAAGSSSWLGQLVTNINATRANFVNDDGLAGSFEHIGDILASPYLTISNQWLLQNNVNNTNLNDEMYEWLPQQTLSLLRVGGSPQTPMRYVVYCYGQTLKPAPNGIVTSGSYFGLCTNYQVVSETATRAVVRFNSGRASNLYPPNDYPPILTNIWMNVPSVTNNNTVIESFNVLQPE